MVFAHVVHFFLGVVASFVGTIPFGPINLSVVDATLKQSLKAAVSMSIAAALVEILQSFIALHCGLLVTMSIEHYPVVKIIVFSLFILIGFLFFFKKTESNVEEKKSKLKASNFTKGAIVGLLNPQAIPFWVFVFTYFQMSHWIDYQLWHVIALLIGVSVGKFLALLMYGLLSLAVAKRIQTLSTYMNKIIGSIFILIGVVQVVKYFWV